MTYTRHYPIHEAASYINWLYFFHAWGFPSRYSSIAKVHGCVACRQNWLQAFQEDERERAEQAMKLFDEAQQLLREWDEAGYCTTFSVRLMEANSDGEDIVLLETQKRLPRGKRAFKLIFAVGEFDMVIADEKTLTCEIFEIKHTENVFADQYKNLVDKEKCLLTEHDFGTITNKTVLYRGEDTEVDGINYVNITKYLCDL